VSLSERLATDSTGVARANKEAGRLDLYAFAQETMAAGHRYLIQFGAGPWIQIFVQLLIFTLVLQFACGIEALYVMLGWSCYFIVCTIFTIAHHLAFWSGVGKPGSRFSRWPIGPPMERVLCFLGGGINGFVPWSNVFHEIHMLRSMQSFLFFNLLISSFWFADLHSSYLYLELPEDSATFPHFVLTIMLVVQGLCAIVWSLGILPSAIALTSLPPYSDEEEDMLFDEFLEYDAHQSGGNHEQAKGQQAPPPPAAADNLTC